MDGVNNISFDNLLGRLKAASEATRLRLLFLLARSELTVSDLTAILGQSQPRISRHLKLLSDAGVIERFPEGAWVYYRLVDTGPGSNLARSLLASLDGSDPQLVRDMERLEQVRKSHADQANEYFDANVKQWDALRARHVAEDAVETAMLNVIGDRRFNAHLDVGTGTGRILELFSTHVERSVGIDANPKMLSVARNKLSDSGVAAQVRQADVYNLAPQGNLLNTVYDLITIHQVLHFLDDPALALSEISRVAGAGSTLLIADFASHGLEFMRAEYAHRRLGFSDEQMFGWLENVGFSDFGTIKLEPETVSGEELTVQIWTAKKT